MTLSDALEMAWRTMEAGGGNEGLMRSLADCGVRDSRMMLAIEEGCRELLFPAEDDFSLSSLGRTRGVRVTVRTQGTGTSTRRYLVLRCTGTDYHGVFRRFAAAVLDEVSAATDPAKAALSAIRAWRDMFNQAGAKSEEALLGIFGELHELRGLVKRNPTAILAWTGPYARPQDFIRGGQALEVKTNRTFVADVEIHGVEQLWSKPYERLVVAAKQIVQEPAGERIADVVAEILHDGAAADELHGRLEALDLDEQQVASDEMPRFTHRVSRYFLVTKDAPALSPDSLRSPLPSAISRLRYRVALDAPGFEEMSARDVDAFLARLSS